MARKPSISARYFKCDAEVVVEGSDIAIFCVLMILIFPICSGYSYTEIIGFMK